MEEDVEDLSFGPDDLLVREREIFYSEDMDTSTKQSQIAENMTNACIFVDDDESSFGRWFFKQRAWILFKFMETNYYNLQEYSFANRDDQIDRLACDIVFASAQKSLENIIPKVSYCNIDDARKLVKAIQEEVFDSFNLLCEDLLIEKSWVVDSIRKVIVDAANFAIDYMNSSQLDKLCFPGNDKQRAILLLSFKILIRGDPEPDEGFLLESNGSTDVADDGLVGLSVGIHKIKDRIMGSDLNLDIISIIGMGGIGKTTLARKVYNDPQVMSLFHVHAWIVVSHEFNERDVYLGLLESIVPLPIEVYKEDTEQLAHRLQRRLRGWRYLIVLDDIWAKEAWDSIKMCFPNDNNGSRILLTTRITTVATHVDPENPHFMSFLPIEESWELLQKRVYGNESCPHHLKNIGMQLADKCQGLPLAIEVMAGHLSSINKTQECWEELAKRVGFPTDATQSESLSKILFTSFQDLPLQLKTCFLTMILFPKNVEILEERLIQVWTAMGILSQNFPDNEGDINLEEVAMTCFESLTNRNLITVKKKNFDGRAKLCGVHDLLWDLSMREFCKQFSCDDDQKNVICINRTLLYSGHSFESDYPISFEAFNLLWVLEIVNQSFDSFPIFVTNLSNLRYLALSTSDNIPHLISKLIYLETFLNYHNRPGLILPVEIWSLAHLKHLRVGSFFLLSKPSNSCFEGSLNSLLPFLSSLSNLSFASCSSATFCNTPHLKQLGIVEEEQDDVGDDLLCHTLENIINLQQLEKLYLRCNYKIQRIRCIPECSDFLPNTIKNLSLSQSHLPWTKMNTLAMLPNLEVLKLRYNAFTGEKWVMNDEQFLRLKYLRLQSMDLMFWNANSDNFPNLRQLHIKFCIKLRGIPKEFGEIYTLELIDLEHCSLIYFSAIEILKEQKAMGNDKFKLRHGRSLPQVLTIGYIIFFVWLATKLNISNSKEEGQEKKHGSTSSIQKDM